MGRRELRTLFALLYICAGSFQESYSRSLNGTTLGGNSTVDKNLKTTQSNKKFINFVDGECPPSLKLSHRSGCETLCKIDADCSADNKCCTDGCSTICVEPWFPRQVVDWTQTVELSANKIPRNDEQQEKDRNLREPCSTSILDGMKPLSCPSQYYCFITMDEDTQSNMPNRGECIRKNQPGHKKLKSVLKNKQKSEAELNRECLHKGKRHEHQGKFQRDCRGCICYDGVVFCEMKLCDNGRPATPYHEQSRLRSEYFGDGESGDDLSGNGESSDVGSGSGNTRGSNKDVMGSGSTSNKDLEEIEKEPNKYILEPGNEIVLGTKIESKKKGRLESVEGSKEDVGGSDGSNKNTSVLDKGSNKDLKGSNKEQSGSGDGSKEGTLGSGDRSREEDGGSGEGSNKEATGSERIDKESASGNDNEDERYSPQPEAIIELKRGTPYPIEVDKIVGAKSSGSPDETEEEPEISGEGDPVDTEDTNTPKNITVNIGENKKEEFPSSGDKNTESSKEALYTTIVLKKWTPTEEDKAKSEHDAEFTKITKSNSSISLGSGGGAQNKYREKGKSEYLETTDDED